MQQNLGCDDESANEGFSKPKSADTCPLAAHYDGEEYESIFSFIFYHPFGLLF